MNYRISNKRVFEQAQLRSVSDVEFTEEQLQNGMKLATAKEDATLELYLVEVDGDKKFEVRWDDSHELFTGWYSAWENFEWCLEIVTPDIPEPEPEAEIELEPETKVETEVEIQVEPEIELETKAEIEPETKIDSESI